MKRIDEKFGRRNQTAASLSTVAWPTTIPIAPPGQLVLNGDFNLGANNFSGWSQHYKTSLQVQEEQTVMVVDQNGYALSDYFPDGTLLYPKSPYSNKDSAFFSTRNFIMLNAVAEKVTAKHPISRRMTERTLKQFDMLRGHLGRRFIPYVNEAPHEWTDPVSPHWGKALRFTDFKKVDDWRQVKREPAAHQTAVSLMHDGENLYIKGQAFDDNLDALVMPSSQELTSFRQGDRIELLVQNHKQRQFLLAFGPGCHFYTRPDIGADRDLRIARDADSWIALARIPLRAFDLDPVAPRANTRLSRLYKLDGAEREESSRSGVSIYNQHSSFWIDLHLDTKE